MCDILFGANSDCKDYSREKLAVRALVLSDTTDGYVPHLLERMGYTAAQCCRVQEDPSRGALHVNEQEY